MFDHFQKCLTPSNRIWWLYLVFPSKFWRLFWIACPRYFRPQYVMFPSYLYVDLIPISIGQLQELIVYTVYPKKYAQGFCFAVLCCGYTLTDFPISIRLTSLALWQSNDCPSASKATLMNMDEYFMWIHYERLHNHNKAKHNKTVCIFLGIYCMIPLE